MSGMTCDPPGVRAAAAVRRLGHELVSHRPDATVLDRVAAMAEDLATAVAATPLRLRPPGDTLKRLAQPVPPDGALLDHGSVCPVSGTENPLGPALTAWREGDAVRATVTLGPAHAGSRGIAHGGVIAALFDDLMGFVMDSLAKTQGFTANLTVSYRKPVPIGTEIELRGRLRRTQGRKLFIVATMELAGAMLAEAEALFVGVAAPSGA